MLNCSHCNQPIQPTSQPTSQSEVCSDCTNLIVHRTPEALRPFVDYLLKHANPEIELVQNGIRLEDISASGTIRGYRSHLSGWSVVQDEPYETETGYYDSLVLQNRELNSRVEILESSELGITICAYVNCVAESTNLQAHKCPKCGDEYSAENPFCASDNLCAFCVENRQYEIRQTEEDLSTIWSAMQSTESHETKQVWTADVASPASAMFIPMDFEDITLPKNRLAVGGVVHSRGLYFNPTRRMLFVDEQHQNCCALTALPNAPTFNDPTFHTYVDEQLQYVPTDLHALVKLITKSGRRFAEQVLNQPTELEVTMSPESLSLTELKSCVPSWLPITTDPSAVDNSQPVVLFVGVSESDVDLAEYVSLICRHDASTTERLKHKFVEPAKHCTNCGSDLVLGHCWECAEQETSLRPQYNDALNALPKYITVWLEALERHHQLFSIREQFGCLKVVVDRHWMEGTEVCLDYVFEHFFCLEQTEEMMAGSSVDDASVYRVISGHFLSPDGKVLVEIHPMTIEATVYPDSIPTWN